MMVMVMVMYVDVCSVWMGVPGPQYMSEDTPMDWFSPSVLTWILRIKFRSPACNLWTLVAEAFHQF